MGSWRVLILGGSSEASALAQALADRRDIDAVLSLAGRTRTPGAMPIATRVGGFGGVDGLVAFLREHGIDSLIDATHPFAVQMSRHAWEAAQQTGVPLIRLTRPPWRPDRDDHWQEVASMAAAAAVLGLRARRVFLTVGRLQLAAFAEAPHHHYTVRTIDPAGPDHGLRDADFIEARGPFAVSDEVRLMRDRRIDILVTKNSGGDAAVAKIEAARQLCLPVVLVRRPVEPGTAVHDVAAVMAAIAAHQAGLALRGV